MSTDEWAVTAFAAFAALAFVWVVISAAALLAGGSLG